MLLIACGLLDMVEAPEDYVRTQKQFGTWFMDPLSSDDRVWVMENFWRNKKVFEYNSISDLLGNWTARCFIENFLLESQNTTYKL